MNKSAEEFKKAIEKAKATGEPVFTASQKKRELHPWQIDIMESIKVLESADVVFSVNKKRVAKGETTIQMDYNGKRLIPLNKNK
jgi:hypothetical protein